MTGGFTYVKTAGPAHLSLGDGGIKFSTNGNAAVCIHIHKPVRALDPTGGIVHPAATVTSPTHRHWRTRWAEHPSDDRSAAAR